MGLVPRQAAGSRSAASTSASRSTGGCASTPAVPPISISIEAFSPKKSKLALPVAYHGSGPSSRALRSTANSSLSPEPAVIATPAWMPAENENGENTSSTSKPTEPRAV